MKFEKKLLAAAVVSALSVNASAVIDLNSSTADPTVYAEEQNTSSSQVYHVESAKVLSNRSLNSGTYAVLFLLDGGGAQFTGTVPTANVTCDTNQSNCGAAGGTYTLTGNFVGADTSNPNNNLANANQGVVFPISVSSNDGIGATDTFTLAASDIKLDTSAGVNLTYRLYDDVSSAELFSNDNVLGGTVTQQLLKFAPVLKNGQPTAPTSVDINVGEESKKLEDSTGATVTNAPLCSFDLQFDADPLYNNTSSSATNVATTSSGPAAMLTTNTDGSKIVVSGDFSAAKDTSGNKDLTRVFMSSGTNCTGSTTTAANAIADDFQSATFFFGNNAPNGGSIATLCYKPDGTTPIVEMKQGALTAQYQPAQATGFTVSNVNLACGKLEKGGSTEDVVMVLNPASAYLQLMRITNPSATAGKVSITAINDKGVAGPNTMEFELPAGNSTGMINTQSIIDATGVVVGSGVNDNVNPVTGGNANKLRLIVNAEFGKSGTSTGVKVRTYAVSSDFTTFSQFD